MPCSFVCYLSLLLAAQSGQQAHSAPAPQGADDAAAVLGADAAPEAERSDEEVDAYLVEESLKTTIVGDRANRSRVAGSAHRVDEAQLERMEYDDIHRVLRQVPGVYTRDEDGFGLRPNIGLRGASSDRSSKVTLMEDGVLLGPAPYSAPAAYYFPLPTRLVGVEVFKGPASIQNGPNTVGGAINLQTRRVPYGFESGLDLAAGLYGAGKAHGHVGFGDEHLGFVLEGVHLRSDGFKRLDGGGETGFERNDVMFKGRLSTGYAADVSHTLELKLGYGDEESHETYLGLSDEDFARTPYRRYAASANDLMTWRRTQAQLRYLFTAGDLDFTLTAYRHDLARDWNKVNRMGSSIPLTGVLANPKQGQSAVLYQVLTGAFDTESPDQMVRVGNNGREFVSQGVQARARYALRLWDIEQGFEVGARLHHDEIRRLHDEGSYRMMRRVLVPDSPRRDVIADNTGSAIAGALYLMDEVRWGSLLVTPGFRLELIHTRFENRLPEEPEQSEGLQLAWMPGVGVSWQALPFLNVLAGVHKGFSPVTPGQPEGTAPEESWSYEAGARLRYEATRAEAIGFLSHYSNLTGECTFSQGCVDDTLNRQYNAGGVLVYGLEATASQSARVFNVEVEAQLAYTLTLSHFLTSFRSSNPLLGDVEEGDLLPYVPVHQGSAQLVLRWRGLEGVLTAHYISEMRDEAGQGELDPAKATQAALLFDAGVSYRFTKASQIYLRTDNVTNTAYLASRRPYGARPGSPVSMVVGYKHDF